MAHILLIEDDELIAHALVQGLAAARYDVEIASDGATGFRRACDTDFSAILLDIMLPGMDGLTLCQTLRQRRRQMPILILTAKDTLPDRIKGLDTGADDYLVKPFEFDELLARLRALLRRDKVHRSEMVRIADLTLDTGNRTVLRGNDPLVLTPREYMLLEALMLQEGRTLSREYIQEHIWKDDCRSSNTVDVCIANLRRKVDGDRRPQLIQTVHRLGYTLRRGDEADN